MSRCFPYPPRGYVRNPVVVAEAESTAKLQKERGKAEKNREKRSEKKALQQGETSKHSKYSHKKRKHEDISAAGQVPKKVSKESVEQLEKSGLSEEHGAPCFIQTARHSPESSQDSSKRRKVVLPSPSQAKNGNILRIKIKSNQDSPAAVLEKPRVLEQPLVQQMGSASTLLTKQNSIQHHNKVNVKSTSAQQKINGGSQAVQKQVSTQLPVKYMRRDGPQTTAKVVQRIDPQLSVKAPVGISGQQPPNISGSVVHQPVRVMGRVDPPHVKTTQRVQAPPAMVQRVYPHLISDIQRKCPPASAKLMQKETSTYAVCQVEVPQPSLMQNPKMELPVIEQHQQPTASLPREEPCCSGRNAESVPVELVKQSSSDRKKSRKAEKKEKKFRDLFVTWNPLSFEMEDSDIGEQDWLLGSTRNSDASMTNCRASGGSLPFQSMEQQPSLQPRALFLPDLHIYQLPYVVPF
ncbi:uncharacterized protein LOC133916546 [Phragmites australis]|uniref:uncharacterized protein LOC133916546 n=1 Tax=Phragmites australis TaxID=29695 RepID=UPI002D769927|nr:uncharacterized protein LOC133916546 [Phragmites australis]